MARRRSFKRSPYHYDDRTGLREHLSNLEWQRGVLTTELDSMLIGDREARIAKTFAAPTKELQPDEKLQQPVIGNNGDDIIFSI